MKPTKRSNCKTKVKTVRKSRVLGNLATTTTKHDLGVTVPKQVVRAIKEVKPHHTPRIGKVRPSNWYKAGR